MKLGWILITLGSIFGLLFILSISEAGTLLMLGPQVDFIPGAWELVFTRLIMYSILTGSCLFFGIRRLRKSSSA